MNIAIITARGGSKRIPHKNIKKFCDRPIIEYSIFPHQMLHIGDSDFFDIEAAQKVGCRTIKWKDKKNI